MSIEFNCSACGKLLRVPEGSGGKQAKCPHCTTVMRIPEMSEDFTESASSAPKDDFSDTPSSDTPNFGASPSNDPFGDPLGISEHDALGGDALGGQEPGQNPFAENPQSPSSGQATYGQPTGGYGMHPHRAGTVLTFGIISVASSGLGVLTCCCCLFGVLPVAGIGFGIPAWIMAKADLEKMAQGTMDPSGHGNTKAGLTTGMIGTILGAVVLILWVVIQVFALVFNIGTSSFQQNGF